MVVKEEPGGAFWFDEHILCFVYGDNYKFIKAYRTSNFAKVVLPM